MYIMLNNKYTQKSSLRLLPIIVLFLINAITHALAIDIEQIEIPAGPYSAGCLIKDQECQLDEGSSGGVKVFVPRFLIDSQETSVAEYRLCVEAGVCERPFDFRRTHYCNYDAPGRDDYPVNCVNWNNAISYCTWHNARLAYEVEW